MTYFHGDYRSKDFYESDFIEIKEEKEAKEAEPSTAPSENEFENNNFTFSMSASMDTS